MGHHEITFKTTHDLQDVLATKRDDLGYEVFFDLVGSALPSTMKPTDPPGNNQFGRRFKDDIFWSIQLRYPGITMLDIKRVADIICI